MKVLVTGGAGFIGSSVVKEALKQGFKVLNIDCLTYAGNLDSLESARLCDNYAFERVNICDREKLHCVFKEYQPDAVMHLAAESHVDRSIDSPSIFLNTNILGTFNLLEEACVHFRTLDAPQQSKFRFHHISTDEVYGDLDGRDELFTEETCYSPSSPYAASKAASDHLVRAWGRTYDLPIIVTNCSNNYGPYHFPEKLIPHVILNAVRGEPIPIYGSGLQVRDWLFVEDHAKALIKVVTDGKIGHTYNIGGHNEKTNLEVVEEICVLLEELAPEKPSGLAFYRDLITFVKDRPGHDARYAIDASKIERELGWVPEETFETGLRKTVQWYLANTSWWEKVVSGAYRMERLGVDT